MTCKVALLVIASTTIMSCATKNSFNSFYNDHKREARLAVAVPKFMVKVFLPKESKDVVNDLTRGMKKIKFLYEEKSAREFADELDDFLTAESYLEYLYIKDDGTKITLHTREDTENIREIVLKMNADEELVIITLQGKMNKPYFDDVLKNSLRDAEKGD